MIVSALGLALCYINRILKKGVNAADSTNYRILVVKASQDSSNQYMNFMNMIFSAEKLVYKFVNNSLGYIDKYFN
jgi:transcription initiation factor TFIIH subunit 3